MGQKRAKKAPREVFPAPLSSSQQRPSRSPDGPRVATFFDGVCRPAAPGVWTFGLEDKILSLLLPLLSDKILSERKTPTMQTRYHVTKGQTRTTVSLDNTLSGLLAIRLGETPNTSAAHAAVRAWLQSRLDEAQNPGRIKVSQWLAGEAMLFVADKNLSEKYLTWLTGI